MSGDGSGRIIQGMDLIDVLKFIARKNRKFQAVILTELEEIFDNSKIDGLGRDSKEFHLIRKLFLDGWNDYTRSVMRTIFGDIEFERYTK